jgi:hypothetical protein
MQYLEKFYFINDEAYHLSKLNEEEVLNFIRDVLVKNTPPYQITESAEFEDEDGDEYWELREKSRLRFDMGVLFDEVSKGVEKNQFIIDLFKNLGIYNYTSKFSLKFHKGCPFINYVYYNEFLEHENDVLGGYTTSELIYEIFKLTIFSGRLPRIYFYDFKKIPTNESELFPFDIFEFNDGNVMLEGKYAGKKCEEIAEIDFRYLIWSNTYTMQRLSPDYINQYLERSKKKMTVLQKEKYLEKIKWQLFCNENYDKSKKELFNMKKSNKKKYGLKELNNTQRDFHSATISLLEDLYKKPL